MKFTELSVKGAFAIDLETHTDERGFFARTFCRDEFSKHGLEPDLAQCSVSWNTRKGTLRGMHFQAAPHETAKLVRCTQGAAFDAIVDMRAGTAGYRTWVSLEITAENRRAIYVPRGCAHGFLTLADNTEILYQMSVAWVPSFDTGVRFDDPAFGIGWPAAPIVISPRDRAWPDTV